MIISPRQAREKHRENSKKEYRFLAGCDRVALARAETFRHRNPRDAARVIGLRCLRRPAETTARGAAGPG